MGARACCGAAAGPAGALGLLLCLLCLLPSPAAGGAAAAAAGVEAALKADAAALAPWLVALRRELHAAPELMFDLPATSARVRAALEELGIPVEGPYATSGLVGRLGRGAPVVALRADMDALPVHEPPGLPFRSKNEGVMHACGHDAHMTMLLGAAKLLKAREASLKGTVLLVFQPAEEGGAGADVMIRAGAIDGADAAFGMHVLPSIPTGQLALRAGTLMAGSLTFKFTVTGRGGHAALPHLNIDPVPAAAALIQALQVLVSRETSPLGSAVLSVTQLQGSDADNIIPDVVTLRGTLRALTHEHMEFMRRRIEEVVPAAVGAYQCNGTVDWQLGHHPYYPPTVNDPAAAALAREAAAAVLGADNVLDTEPIMPAEDFAFFTRAVPSSFMFIGIRNESVGATANLHSPAFALDEGVLPLGAAVHANLALRFLDGGLPGGGGGGARDELPIVLAAPLQPARTGSQHTHRQQQPGVAAKRRRAARAPPPEVHRPSIVGPRLLASAGRGMALAAAAGPTPRHCLRTAARLTGLRGRYAQPGSPATRPTWQPSAGGTPQPGVARAASSSGSGPAGAAPPLLGGMEHTVPGAAVRDTIALTPEERALFDTLLAAARFAGGGTVLRAAGGWVRDKLLGRESKDIDIALDNMLGKDFADKVNEYLAAQGRETRSAAVIHSNPDQSKHLETARMRVDGLWVDLVNLRSESYADGSRIPTMEFGTPLQDAMRRDFTINSLFYNLNAGAVEDLTGTGLDDLRAGRLRTPLPPHETFMDDPLRVLRAR
ncbi:ILL5 [Scenedesmus sp. PABB004]|nr:ILL5 [Scenedesmus sp. PABB004]